MSVTEAAGFRATGVAAGLKTSGQPDIAVVANDGPRSSAAAVFTSNRCKANPVLWSEEVIKGGSARAVAINSGGANCYTGSAGYEMTKETAELVADEMNIATTDVQVCSTGLIGLLNNKDALLAGMHKALDELSPTGGDKAAAAIMTTDTVAKEAVQLGDGYVVGGMAKGAGMLAPALATMLVCITTDADVDAETCDAALREATRTTFDRLDSDGCQSTNDSVVLMASGASKAKPDAAAFTEAVRSVCHKLAHQLLVDAEGSEHDITIEVRGAATEDDALEVGRSIARSNLFKCAIFGKDPNWGRILASVGTTDAKFDPANLDVALNDVWVCRGSGPDESPENVNLDDRAVSVTVDLKSGSKSAAIWTNDLTHTYVHENSAYSS